MTLSSLRNKLLLSLAFAVVVLAMLIAYGDLSQLATTLTRFRWELLPAILGLTLLNYALRFLKWEYYLKLVGVRGLSRRESFYIFFSGLAMTVTPAKVGEWLKSYLLREMTGVAMSRTAPVIVAERLTDGLAMVLLALGGLFAFGLGWQIVLASVLLAAALVGISQYRPLALRLLAVAPKLPLVGSMGHHLHQFYESANTLLSPLNLLLAVGIGFVSWFGECLAFYLVLVGLGVEGAPLLVVQAAFILATSSLAASLLLLPGGLGAAEGGIVGLSQLLLGVSREVAVAGALIIRLCTLWFAVALGLVTLLFAVRRLGARCAAGAPAEPELEPRR